MIWPLRYRKLAPLNSLAESVGVWLEVSQQGAWLIASNSHPF